MLDDITIVSSVCLKCMLVWLLLCLYSAVSLTLVKEQRFTRFILLLLCLKMPVSQCNEDFCIQKGWVTLMSHSKVLCKLYYLFHHKTKSIFHHEYTTKSIFHHAVKSSNRFLALLCDAVDSFGRVLQTLLCMSCCITAMHQFSSLETRTAATASRSTPATPWHFKGFTD